MSVVKETDKQVSIHFASLLELMDHELPPGEHRDAHAAFTGKEIHHEFNFGGRSWLGPDNANYEDVMRHALLGDDVLYENLQHKIVELDRAVGTYTKDYIQVIQKVKRKKFRSNFGDEIDIHKVYQGQLDTAWATTKRIEADVKHHLVTILVDYAGNASNDVNESLWRAAVAVKLVDDLTKAGKSVKLVVGSHTKNAMVGTNKDQATSVVIKKYDEHLSLPRVAAMTHIGFFRTAGFAMKHCQHRTLHDNYGVSVPMNNKNLPIHLQEEVDAGHTKYVLVPRINSLSDAVFGLNKAYETLRSLS